MRPGLLTIVSPARFQLLQPTGLTPQATATSTATAGGGTANAAYRVDRPDPQGRLTWELEPPRVKVVIESQLSILPEYASWVAALRYDVTGGPVEAVHLKLPMAWVAPPAQVTVKLPGETLELTAETRGADTYWMIVPKHPIWGVQGLIVKSLIPLPKRAELTFPVVSPLGRGAVNTYLSVLNASGRAVSNEVSPELKPVADETRFRPEEFAGLSPSLSPPSVMPSLYHVEREGWFLKVRWPREPEPVPVPVAVADPRQDPEPDGARVGHADLVCTLRPDGSWVGVATYEVAPRSESFLTIVPPARSEPLWAAIDNLPVPPLRAASGRWLIPLGETTTTPDRVEVRMIWTTASTAGAGSGSVRKDTAEPLALPVLTQRHVPTSVTVYAPAGVDVRSTSSLLETSLTERLEVGRVEWQGKQIAAGLSRLDPNSPRDGAMLVSDLVQFQLLLRDAERSAYWNPTSPLAYRELRISRIEERTRIAESALATALEKYGLEEFAESARIHVGLTADDPDSSTLEIPEPNAIVRVRRSGQPYFFQGDAAEPNRTATANLVFATLGTHGLFQRPLDWALFVLVTIAALAAVVVAVRAAEQARWIGPATLAVALLVLGVEAGPMALAAGLAMSWLGYVHAGRAPQEAVARP
jgi:hypothetical protein